MNRTLVLTFESELTKNQSFRINNVKESITEEEVRDIASAIITENVFSTNTGDYKNLVSAKVLIESEEVII